MEWKPPEEGRYKIGNPESPFAICTTASVDMEFPLDKIAIYGKCVTENTGIEKMVKNILSNPNITYLIICGRESMGHFIDNAVMSLIENGTNAEGRIIGAKGGIPVLEKLTSEEIERFRLQISAINMTGEMDIQKIMDKVDELAQFKMDSNYYIINANNDTIEVICYYNSRPIGGIKGEKAFDILKSLKIDSVQHHNYMKRELYKAERALKEKREYIQDE